MLTLRRKQILHLFHLYNKQNTGLTQTLLNQMLFLFQLWNEGFDDQRLHI